MKRINPMNKITTRSIGFHLRQILFFANHPEFKPDTFCRKEIDEQIKLIDPSYLDKDLTGIALPDITGKLVSTVHPESITKIGEVA